MQFVFQCLIHRDRVDDGLLHVSDLVPLLCEIVHSLIEGRGQVRVVCVLGFQPVSDEAKLLDRQESA